MIYYMLIFSISLQYRLKSLNSSVVSIMHNMLYLVMRNLKEFNFQNIPAYQNQMSNPILNIFDSINAAKPV